MTNNHNSLTILVFNWLEYDYWSIKMRMLMTEKYIWDIVEFGYDEPADWNSFPQNDREAKKQAKKMNSLALYHIHLALNKSLFHQIADARITKDA